MYLSITHKDNLQPFSDLENIVRQINRSPGKIYLLHGHSSVFTTCLMIGGAIRQQIAVVDGSMRFNSYLHSNVAKTLHILPKQLLQKTYITRSFTAFQTESAITTKLPRFLKQTHCPMVIVLGLLGTYYDEQVKPHECRQSLLRIIHTFRELTTQNIHILIADVEVPNPPLGKHGLFSLIRDSADIVLIIKPNNYEPNLITSRI